MDQCSVVEAGIHKLGKSGLFSLLCDDDDDDDVYNTILF